MGDPEVLDCKLLDKNKKYLHKINRKKEKKKLQKCFVRTGHLFL